LTHITVSVDLRKYIRFMKTIAVFGASGLTGKEVIREANSRGINTKSFVRRAGSTPELDLNFEITGDFTDKEAITSVIKGVDAVIITIGQRPPYEDIFCKDATAKIIAIAANNNVNRIICQTGALIGDYPENQKKFFKFFGRLFDKKYPKVKEDRIDQEEVLKRSDSDWTIVKPPRLTNGNKKRRCNCAPGVRTGIFSKISRKELASLLVDLTTSKQFAKKVVFAKA
jgi:putative NADH-flavin reductase